MSGKTWMACVALAALGSMTSAHADGGTISFQGVIAEPTCGLQYSGENLTSVCRNAQGLAVSNVKFNENQGPVTIGTNSNQRATLTVAPLLKAGAPMPGVFVAQVQYI